MPELITRPDEPTDIGIALLLPDGSVRIPGIGMVNTQLDDLHYDGGTYCVRPGKVIVVETAGAEVAFEYDTDRWTTNSHLGHSFTRYILPLLSLSLFLFACIVVGSALS